MKARAVAIAAGLGAYVVLGAVATGYLAAATFQVANRVMPRQLTATRWFDDWALYGQVPKLRRRLQFAAGFSIAAVFVVPSLVVASAGQRRRPPHGDARFARGDEIGRAGLFTEERGIIVGRDRGRYLVFGGQQFVFLAAPTRSGKGVGVVIPNLLNYPDSVVVLDIKLENFAVTSGFRERHGQQVFLFAPFSEDGRTHRWNPLDGVSRDPNRRVGDVLAIAQALYPSDGRQDVFWNEQARNLFMGLALYLFETPELPVTFGELLRQSSGKGRPIKEYLTDLMSVGSVRLSGTCLDALSRFTSTSDNTLSGILATFNAPLTIFANPLVDAATAASDFDLRDVRRRRMSIYVGIPPNRLGDAALLVNLFFSQLINLNTELLPEQDPTLRYQCLLILDEFAAIGRIGVLSKAVAFIAGYNLRLLPIVQSIAQLQAVYGDRDARTFVTNHAMQVIFAPREQRDANEYSEMLGYYTEAITTQSVTRPRGLTNYQGSQSENHSEQRRALMLPQELKEIGPDKEIVLLENCRPILCEKIRYYDDPTFQSRLYPPPVVPVVDLDLTAARNERRVRELGNDEAVRVEQLVIKPNLPMLDDPQTPSEASCEAVVAAVQEYLNAVALESHEQVSPDDWPVMRRADDDFERGWAAHNAIESA